MPNNTNNWWRNLPVIITIIIAISSIAVSMGINKEKIATLENEIIELKQDQQTLQALSMSMSRIETKIIYIEEALKELKIALEKRR